ncbi:hypothetical protein B0H14DRAFT_3523292 [Mycena olivaceomarginata]|nr:hypothetical protein B0H14DRAFT_3523292 [Mycena olivaceomarginata]
MTPTPPPTFKFARESRENTAFIEYPGWLFWHPETKKEVISDRADFDERYFPGNNTRIPDASPTPAPVPSVYTPLPLVQDHESVNKNDPPKDPLTAPRTRSSSFGSSLSSYPLSPPPAPPPHHRRTEAERLIDEIPPFLKLDANPKDIQSYDVPDIGTDDTDVGDAHVVSEPSLKAGLDIHPTAGAGAQKSR